MSMYLYSWGIDVSLNLEEYFSLETYPWTEHQDEVRYPTLSLYPNLKPNGPLSHMMELTNLNFQGHLLSSEFT
jgi:hypothetical protein